MTHPILKPSFTRVDARGTLQEILNDGHWESLLTGSMNPGAVTGNHYHLETIVFFYVVRGAVTVKTVHVETGARAHFTLGDSEGVLLVTHESHAIHFDAPTDFIMLKSKQYDPDAPDTYPLVVE